MRGFKFVSGNDWWDDPNAPWNEPTIVYKTCPDCGGYGGFWCNESGDEITKEKYDGLGEDERVEFEFVECETCEGVGTIAI